MQCKHGSHCHVSHVSPTLFLYSVLQCPDFEALEAQAVSYLTHSAKHSNAAAARFDRQLRFIESTMGEAKEVSLTCQVYGTLGTVCTKYS